MPTATALPAKHYGFNLFIALARFRLRFVVVNALTANALKTAPSGAALVVGAHL
jgi:hypothetical protein